MRKLFINLFLLAIVTVLGVVTSAQALPYIPPANTPIYFQFNNLEQVDQRGINDITVPGINPLTGNTYLADFGKSGNWGVFNISTVQLGGIATLHQDISGGQVDFADSVFNGGQIHGIFHDIQLTSGTKATGGMLDIYYTDADFVITAADLNGAAAPDAATVAKFTAGTFLARLNFAPGIINGDPTTTILSTIDLFSSLTAQGHADSFANVDTSVVGLWTALLDGNWFYVDTDGDGIFGEAGEQRDVRFSNFFNELAAWNGTPAPGPTAPGIAGLRSNDPGRVYTVGLVPEPNTAFLLGVGLLGLAATLRRKFNR